MDDSERADGVFALGIVDLCYDDDGNWDGLWEGCLRVDFRCSSLTVLLWYLSRYRDIIVIFFSQLEWNGCCRCRLSRTLSRGVGVWEIPNACLLKVQLAVEMDA